MATGQVQGNAFYPITDDPQLVLGSFSIPGLYFFLRVEPLNSKKEDVADHHTPDFYIDENGMKLGVTAMVNLTLDSMELKQEQ